MKIIFEAADPMEAHLVRDLLRNAGIDAVCLDVGLWGGRGELAANCYPRVALANPRDRVRAEALLREYRRPSTQADWRCHGCGETVDGGMGLCWNCGAAAPDN